MFDSASLEKRASAPKVLVADPHEPSVVEPLLAASWRTEWPVHHNQPVYPDSSM